MIYQDLVKQDDGGIYTILLDSLKNSEIELSNSYVTAQRLDARFAFENNLKECYFNDLTKAVDVLIAKYYDKWNHLITSVLKSELPTGVSSITKTANTGGTVTTNKISAYDSNDLIPDDSSSVDNDQTITTTTTDITGTQFIMSIYKNNVIYDIINTDIRRTLFTNIVE